jgi:acetoin:2,6-dichlorophenolindophenol oxidoreductase subunit beta
MSTPKATADGTVTYREAICAALDDELSSDPEVVLFGEDVASAGGVFKTNEGLVDRHGPERVFNTPICENAFIGVALGMSVNGTRPIVEVMFSDFLPTAADALINELAKFRFMSGGQAAVPVTVRSMGGASGRFGTQHSATGESWFIQFPGLRVGTASTPSGIYGVLRAAVRDDNPTLVIEHKGLFNRKGHLDRGDHAIATIGKADILRQGDDITIVSTLLMAHRAAEAADRLSGEGIHADVIDLRWLRPLDFGTVRDSVARSGRLLIVEEQVHQGGWGAAVISRLAMEGISLRSRPRALGLAGESLIAYSPELEDALLPDADDIFAAAKAALDS